MRSYNPSLDYNKSVMILPSIRSNLTPSPPQSSNFGSRTIMPSFFPQRDQRPIYNQSSSKHLDVIEIEPDIDIYEPTKKFKPDYDPVNVVTYPNRQNKNQISSTYNEDYRQYNHRLDFPPRTAVKPVLQVIDLDASDGEDNKDDDDCQIVNVPEKVRCQKPISISINDNYNSIQGNGNGNGYGYHPYHYQNVGGYQQMRPKPLLSHYEIFNKTPQSPAKSESSVSSAFYSPTNHEFLAELDSREDGPPLTPKAQQISTLNTKRAVSYDNNGEFSPKVKVVERIDLEKVDAIVISECEEDDGYADYEQTECTYTGLESRHISTVDTVVSKPSQEEKVDTLVSIIQPEEKQIMIKTSQEKSKKLAKKRQIKQNKSSKEDKESKGSSLKKKRKAKRTENQLLLSQDTGPSWKTSRGLNKLQLFRYQMDVVINDEETVEKIGFFESEGKLDQLLKPRKIEKSNSKQDLYADQVATIPAMDKRVTDKKKGPLVPVWDPKAVKESELNEYLKQLKQIVKETIIDEERAFRLLKMFNLSTKLALGEAKINMTYYKEILTQRFRRYKRRV